MVMRETFVDLNTAILAKQKGFDGDCIILIDLNTLLESNSFWKDENGNNVQVAFIKNSDLKKINACTIPSQSLLQKWLREKHKLHTVIIYTINGFTYKIVDLKLNHDNVCDIVFESYEDALENALYNMLTLI